MYITKATQIAFPESYAEYKFKIFLLKNLRLALLNAVLDLYNVLLLLFAPDLSQVKRRK